MLISLGPHTDRLPIFPLSCFALPVVRIGSQSEGFAEG